MIFHLLSVDESAGRVTACEQEQVSAECEASVSMKTIIIGLGNPILGDDGVGWKVAEEVKKQLPPDSPVEVQCLSLGGLGLMEHLIGYGRAILVDAFASEDQPGSIMILKLADLPNYSAFHTTSAHDTSLQSAVELGRSMGASLPEEVEIVGIVTNRIHDFSEELSPPVAEAVPFAARIILDLLGQAAPRRKEFQLLD
jgi:hydrogenase maturation protease